MESQNNLALKIILSKVADELMENCLYICAKAGKHTISLPIVASSIDNTYDLKVSTRFMPLNISHYIDGTDDDIDWSKYIEKCLRKSLKHFKTSHQRFDKYGFDVAFNYLFRLACIFVNEINIGLTNSDAIVHIFAGELQLQLIESTKHIESEPPLILLDEDLHSNANLNDVLCGQAWNNYVDSIFEKVSKETKIKKA